MHHRINYNREAGYGHSSHGVFFRPSSKINMMAEKGMRITTQQNEYGSFFKPAPISVQRDGPAQKVPDYFESCTPNQEAELKQHIATARQWVNDAEPKIHGYLKGNTNAPSAVIEKAMLDNFQTKTIARIEAIAAAFTTLKNGINSKLDFKCAPECTDKDALGETPTYFATWRNMHICPPWFACNNQLVKTGTIVHESSHRYLGIVDHAYEYERSYKFMQPEEAMNNAASYAVAARQVYFNGANGPGQQC